MLHWIWQNEHWPHFTWKNDKVLQIVAACRQQQGKLIGARALFAEHDLQEAGIKVFIDESLSTSAIEGEKINPDAVRSSIAKRLGLNTFGLPNPPRNVDGLVEILFDATTHFHKTLTLKQLCAWQAALFPTGYSGLMPIRTGELRGKEPMQVVSGAMGKEVVHFEAPPLKGLKKQVLKILKPVGHGRSASYILGLI
ncbi:MAG: DUF4172 domain-containing protein [Bdellovibrionota bacterium]